MENFWVIKRDAELIGKNYYHLVRCNLCFKIHKRRKNSKSFSCGCKRGATGATKPGAEQSAWNSYIQGYKHSAKARGYVWELTEKEFKEITQKSCTYCGTEPTPWTKLFNQLN